jgi:hypothetical protein
MTGEYTLAALYYIIVFDLDKLLYHSLYDGLIIQ